MQKQRLKILSKSEINELYGIPKFTENEQKNYFSLSKKEHKLMSERGSLASKVHFILQLGYFRANSQFFNCQFDEVKQDVSFILREFFNNKKLVVNAVNKDTRRTNQNIIAQCLGYQIDKAIVSQHLQKMLEIKVKLSGNPVYLFHAVLCYCREKKFTLLGYSSIQKLIGDIITKSENIISEMIQKYLLPTDWKLIDAVFNKNNSNDYILSELKKDPTSFKTKQIKEEIAKLKNHEALYKIAKNVLPKLNITAQNIQYYASLALHFPITDLKKLSKTKQAIYLLCYAHHSHHKINDNLMISFSHYIEKFKSESNINARDKILDEKLEINNDVKNAALVFRFFDDHTISNNESFGSIRKRAQQHVKKGKFNDIADYLLGLLFDFQEIKWDEIVKLKKKITANLRPIFHSLTFDGDHNQKNLLLAIAFLKNYFLSESTTVKKSKLKNIPIQCIPHHWKKHLMKNNDPDTIDMTKYEFMIYHLIADQIDAGHIYLQNSISFKSLSSHLMSNEKWKDKEKILKELGNKKLLTPIDQLLNDFENTLEKLIVDVNKRIENGDNTGIKIKREKRKNQKQKESINDTEGEDITFTLPYPDTADKENNPIFKQISQISIAEVLQFAQKHCAFRPRTTESATRCHFGIDRAINYASSSSSIT